MNLTAVDIKMLAALSLGKISKQIADEESVCVNAVEVRRVRLFKKMKASNAAHAVAIGFRNGIIQ